MLLKNSIYGPKLNRDRIEKGIPIITDDLEPENIHTNYLVGNWWNNNDTPTDKKKLIHAWKLVQALPETGWVEERDAFRYFMNDSTCYQINIFSLIQSDSVSFKYELGLVDLKHQTWDDYVANKKVKYDWRTIGRHQKDSVFKAWDIK